MPVQVQVRLVGGCAEGDRSTIGMKLTEKQEARVERFLHESVPDTSSAGERPHMLNSLKESLRSELARHDAPTIGDADLEAVLERCAVRAAATRAPMFTPPAATPSSGAVWLGVCAATAQRFDASPLIIRFVLVALALIPPLTPIVLLAYVIAFFVMYYGTSLYDFPRPDPMRVLRNVGFPASLAIALHAVAMAALFFVAFFYTRGTGMELELDGRWTWLERSAGTYLFWVLVVTASLAAIGGLTANLAWEKTLLKISHAILALYAVLLAYGVASVVVAAIIMVSENLAITGEIETMLPF